MKRLPLFPLLAQVALVCAVVYACSDSTSPANSRAALSPKNPELVLQGEHPPPPVETAISVCLDAVCPVYTGTYFSNGSSLASTIAAAAIGDAEIFGGTSWLKFDQTKPTAFATVSANARFKKQEEKLSGMGKFTVGIVDPIDYTITTVDQFIPYGDCGHAGQLCANIIFHFYRGTDPNNTGTGSANAVGCEVVLQEGGGTFLDCGSSIG
jgi:hypothetical protein